MRSTVLASVCLLIVTGCTRGGSTAPSVPEPQRLPGLPDRGVVTEGTTSWSFSPSSTLGSYVTTESTTVSLDNTRDSSITITSYTLLTRQRDSVTGVQGTLDRISSSANTANATESLPFPFTGFIRNGGLVIDSIGGQRIPGVMTCENPMLNHLTSVRRNVFTLPSTTLTKNQTWTDSSTVPACSGSIPVQITSIRSYRVLGETEGVVLVDRQDKTVATGEGAQGQHRILLTARGSGSTQLRLDRLTGEVLSTSGTAQTEVDIGSSGRLQRFVQVVRGHTVRR